MQAFSKEAVKMKKYQIQFSGLKPGTYSFDFGLDDLFFEHYGIEDVSGSRISVHIDLEKEDKLLVLRFDVAGTVVLICDRCGDPLTEQIKGQENLLVKLSDHYEEESDDVQIIKESDGKYDFSQFLYESVRLMLPFHPVHGEDGKGKSRCNPEVLKRLEELNESHNPDPRWEVLNKLKENIE